MNKSFYYILCALLGLSLCACSCGGGQEATPPVSQGTTITGGASSGSTADSISDVVIADNSQCAFVVTAVDTSADGCTVSARCENRSDRTLMFSWDECSVNGWMIDPFWAEEVTPGNTASTRITFDRRDLDRCGITSVDEIEFELHIYDSDDWEADPVVSDDYTIYPTGLGPGRIDIPQRVPKDSEKTIVDDKRCTFIIESADPEGVMGYTLMCYLENKTDDELMFSWSDVAVNGIMLDPFWAAEVEDGKRAYAEISFLQSDFEDNNITSVEKIEFRLRVYDSDDWDKAAVVDEVFVFSP